MVSSLLETSMHQLGRVPVSRIQVPKKNKMEDNHFRLSQVNKEQKRRKRSLALSYETKQPPCICSHTVYIHVYKMIIIIILLF